MSSFLHPKIFGFHFLLESVVESQPLIALKQINRLVDIRRFENYRDRAGKCQGQIKHDHFEWWSRLKGLNDLSFCSYDCFLIFFKVPFELWQQCSCECSGEVGQYPINTRIQPFIKQKLDDRKQYLMFRANQIKKLRWL